MIGNPMTKADELLIDQKIGAIANIALNLTMIRSIIGDHVARYNGNPDKQELIRKTMVKKFLCLLEKELGDA